MAGEAAGAGLSLQVVHTPSVTPLAPDLCPVRVTLTRVTGNAHFHAAGSHVAAAKEATSSHNFFKKYFIYLFMIGREREREREAETQEEGEAGAMPGA